MLSLRLKKKTNFINISSFRKNLTFANHEVPYHVQQNQVLFYHFNISCMYVYYQLKLCSYKSTTCDHYLDEYIIIDEINTIWKFHRQQEIIMRKVITR